MIIGLSSIGVSIVCGYLGAGLRSERENVHCQTTAQLDDPDGTADELHDRYDENAADDDGTVACPGGGIPPFGIAFPGKVVEAESCRHAEVLSQTGGVMDDIIELSQVLLMRLVGADRIREEDECCS